MRSRGGNEEESVTIDYVRGSEAVVSNLQCKKG